MVIKAQSRLKLGYFVLVSIILIQGWFSSVWTNHQEDVLTTTTSSISSCVTPLLSRTNNKMKNALSFDTQFHRNRPFLSAMILFKDESHALVELLLHLLSQGVDHVFLIDNGSNTTRFPTQELEEFRRRGHITLLQDTRAMAQRKIYRWVSQRIRFQRPSTVWFLPVDADEFPWATQVGSLRNLLLLQDPKICSIAMPFRFYGSSGRQEQPQSILQGFLHRRNDTLFAQQETAKAVEQNRSEPMYMPISGFKTMARFRCTAWMAVHSAALFPWIQQQPQKPKQQQQQPPDGDIINNDSRHPSRSIVGIPGNPPRVTSAHLLESAYVVVNHYRIQSFQFYMEIKHARGGANNNNKVRDANTFRREDFGDTMDDRLAERAMARFGRLYYQEEEKEENSAQHEDRRHNNNKTQAITRTTIANNNSTPPSPSPPEDAALRSISDWTNPWSMTQIQNALEELRPHQMLVFMDGRRQEDEATTRNTKDDRHSRLLNQLIHNAAMLDTTMDCLVFLDKSSSRNTRSFVSTLKTFCQVLQPEEDDHTTTATTYTTIWDLSQRVIQEYSLIHYDSYMILESSAAKNNTTVLESGMDTATLRHAANQLAVGKEWTEHAQKGVWLFRNNNGQQGRACN